MAQIVYVEQALLDLERTCDFPVETELAAAEETVHPITDAVMVLERHPYIGRMLDEDLRELIISRGKSGYVALYSFEEIEDTILILSVQHQCEAGYL